MPTNRIRLARPLIDSRAKAEEILGEIALLTLERNGQKLEMDRELTAVREQYEVPLTALGKQLEEKSALLEGWAATNPEEFPKGRKSLDMLHGVIGYRTGTPKLKTVLRKTWDAVLETLKAFHLTQYVRIKEEVNKEAIIADAQAGNVDEATLRKVGITVSQEESFFVEPKLEVLENRTRSAA